MNDFEYLLNEVFGKPSPKNINTERINQLINDMENNDLGSVDRIKFKTSNIYFKANSSTSKRAIVPYTKAFKNLGWTLYVRW